MSASLDRRTWPAPISDVVETALGEAHRDDPALPTSGGPAGNARLAAWTGVRGNAG